MKIDRHAKAITSREEAKKYLRSLTEPKPQSKLKKGQKNGIQAKFSDRDAEVICSSIEVALALLRPIEEAVLSRTGITSKAVSAFMAVRN